jgi:hypothetical protein
VIRDETILRLAILFCFTVAVATWIGTMPGGAAFLLGIAFGFYLVPRLLRWAER